MLLYISSNEITLRVEEKTSGIILSLSSSERGHCGKATLAESPLWIAAISALGKYRIVLRLGP